MLLEPEPHGLILTGSSFRIEFRRDGDRLRAELTGVAGCLATVTECWRMIASETVRSGVSMLLVVDHSSGDALTLEELEQFIRLLAGIGLEGVRVAYVGSDPAKAVNNEATEIYARERGFITRVFHVESDATTWLRHGER
ncbi:MAG: hypothetical protein ABIO84_05110 [Lysobacter sp.]